MPGWNRVPHGDPTEMLETLSALTTDIDELRTKVASGEATQADALDRALRGLQELAGVLEPVVRFYKQKM